MYADLVETVYLSSKKMDTVTRVQILDETVGISHSTLTLAKGLNPTIFPSAIVK